MTKFIDSLVERSLAESRRLKQAVQTAKAAMAGLAGLAHQVARMASAMRDMQALVAKHEMMLREMAQMQTSLVHEVVQSSIDTSLPNMSPLPSDKEKPN